MAAIAGDIIEVRYAHPTLGSGVFYPKSGEGSTFDYGGFRRADDAQMMDGSGAAIKQFNRTMPFFEVTVANDDNTREDLSRATALAGSPVDATWTIAHFSGAIYQLQGSPVGDLQGELNDGTFTLKVSGSNQAIKIA